MELEVYTVSDIQTWRSALEALPNNYQDIYFTSSYHKLHELNGDGKALCIVIKEGNSTWINCSLINSINRLGYDLDKEYYDLQSVYGYTGIVGSNVDQAFQIKASRRFKEYCNDNNIIAQFSRFHPLLDNAIFCHEQNLIFDRQTVVVDLTRGYEHIWLDQYTSKTRNMVKKAQKVNYSFDLTKNPSSVQIDAFIDIYYKSMLRTKADAYYLFNRNFFHNLFNELGDYAYLINIKNARGITACSGIFLMYKKYFHYHLSGRDEDADNSVNSYLIDVAIQLAIDKRCDFLHLGGGRSGDTNDSLLRFKKGFSTNHRNFFIEKDIFNSEIYKKVVHQWESRFPSLVPKFNNHLLKYRNLLNE